MSALRVVGLVLGFTLPLFAQRPSLNERQLGTYKGNEDAVRSAMSYCNVIYDSLQEQQSRIFALDKVDVAGTRRQHWAQVADRDEWNALSQPAGK